MFAVIKAGGKQYRVAPEDIIRIDRVSSQPGEIVEFGEVLVLGGDTPQIGTPAVAGATVAGEVLQHTRGDKVIAFKKRRRQNSRRKRGLPARIFGDPHYRNPDRRRQALERGKAAAQTRTQAQGRNHSRSGGGRRLQGQPGQEQGQDQGQNRGEKAGRKKAC